MEPQPFLNIANDHRPKPHPSQTPFNREENLPTFVTPAVTSASKRIIRMGTGRCGFQIRFGTLFVLCPCTQGRFYFHPDSGTFKDECTECSHSSSMHHDIDVIADAPPSGEARAAELKKIKTGESHIVKDNPSSSWELSKYYNPETATRESTITSLFAQLQRVRVIYVRGTPASGKSTLCRLLYHHVKSSRSDIDVQLVLWKPNIPPDIPWEDFLRKTNTLILLDEAQATYTDVVLWPFLIKPVAENRSGPMIALFGSYGSPIEGPRSFEITPMQFAPDQRMSLRPISGDDSKLSIFFTRSEFDDCISRIVTASKVDEQSFLPSKEFVEQLWVLTNGHPGVTREMMRFLMNALNGTVIPAGALLDFVRDKNRLYQRLSTTGVGRSFPKKQIILDNPKLAEFFREVLVSDYSTEKPDMNPSLDLCFKEGWLQAEIPRPTLQPMYFLHDYIAGSRSYIISCGCLQIPNKSYRYIENLLSLKSPPFPVHLFPELQGFCIATIKSFSRSSLVSNMEKLGTGALKRPLEAQYQDEIYRASYKLLGKQIYLSSEWSPAGLDGRVDFQVTSMKWAVECLREGDRLKEHLDRFEKEDGHYYHWIRDGHIEKYILVDFRTSEPPRLTYSAPCLIFAVFDKHFRECTIYNSTGDRLDKFAIPA